MEDTTKEDQILITLIKLRHNFPHFDLAVIFHCNKTIITNIVITWINSLNKILFKKSTSKLPLRYKNKLCILMYLMYLNVFKPFLNSRIVIDLCLLLFLANP